MTMPAASSLRSPERLLRRQIAPAAIRRATTAAAIWPADIGLTVRKPRSGAAVAEARGDCAGDGGGRGSGSMFAGEEAEAGGAGAADDGRVRPGRLQPVEHLSELGTQSESGRLEVVLEGGVQVGLACRQPPQPVAVEG